MLQIGVKKVLLLKTLKILFHGHKLLVTLVVKKWLECFMTELQKTNQTVYSCKSNIGKR